jgi:hypothetical protein
MAMNAESTRVKMIADAKFRHEGRMVLTNDEFETDIGNAKDLVAMRFAHFKPTTLSDLPQQMTAPRRGSYRRHDIQTAPQNKQVEAEAEE